MSPSDYDLAVIGGGSAGYAAARTASAAGLRTVVLEGGPEIGGLCILRGCMPTKSLLYAAEVRHLTRHAATWGLGPQEAAFDFAAVQERKNRLIREFADDRVQQLTAGKFEFVRASARFVDSHQLALSTGGALTARNFIISAGSIVAPPPLPQLQPVGYLTSDDALKLERLPQSLIVLGGGPVAVELAQFFARFDVKVTLVQRGEHVLRDLDTDAASVLESVFRREGIAVHTGTRLLAASRQGDLKVVAFEQAGRQIEVAAEEILFALGRVPNTASLGLENAGVNVDLRGRIVTDTTMATSAPHIYAAGDCTGPHEIVHLAIQQGEIAAHNIAHPEARRSIDYRLLVHVVFTDPQIGCVGLTEQIANRHPIPHLVARYPFSDHGKSLILEAKDGFVKLLAMPVTGEILGGCCVGPLGGELIHEIVAAMHGRMTVRDLATLPHYHPTLAEIWTYPAEELAAGLR
ncbi:MAG: NAD(P)/FAD-dependent oxidoreductase [Verrucomicrobia bacterium]|nr:NAD(P)/FAD-dependent oxidoreductase [Verrucomicrobiota bacterium]